ncbi:MAG: transporter substrate-binding domain-containing protein [Amaricoccus sp.]
MRIVPGLAVLAVGLGVAAPIRALDICVEGAYPPFSEVLADGSIVGFDIDMTKALCARIGEECRLVLTSWNQMIPSLIGDRCDAIIASMSDTRERRKQIDFSARYYVSPVRFVGPAGTTLADTAEALDGKVVGVQRGTTNQVFMEVHYPATELRLYDDEDHVMLDLYAGRLDATLGEAVQLDVGFLRTPAGEGFAFFGAPHFDPAIQGSGAAVAVRKDEPDLRDRFSQAIAALRADGTYQQIAGRYFQTDIYGE